MVVLTTSVDSYSSWASSVDICMNNFEIYITPGFLLEHL